VAKPKSIERYPRRKKKRNSVESLRQITKRGNGTEATGNYLPARELLTTQDAEEYEVGLEYSLEKAGFRFGTDRGRG